MAHKNSQSGRSMVEILGVIAIIALITISGITSMTYLNSSYKVNATILEIDDLAQNIIDTYSWNRTYDDLSIGSLCEDAEMSACTTETTEEENDAGETVTNNTTTLTNKWGGMITVSGEDTIFYITYSGLPNNVCQQLHETNYHYVTPFNVDCNDGTDASSIKFVSIE